MEDLKNIQKAIEDKLDATITKIEAGRASKEEVDSLNKQMLNLKATIAAQGEDAERDTRSMRKAMWTGKMKRDWTAACVKAFDKANVWQKSNTDGEVIRKGYLAKATNINQEDSTSGAGMLPTLVDSVIHQLIPLYGVARNYTNFIGGIQGSINVNSLTAYPAFGPTITTGTQRDDATVTPNAPTYAKVNIQPLQCSGLVPVTEQLIFNSVPGILENAAEALAISAGLFEDQVLFTGDGTVNYLGFTGLATNSSVGNSGTSYATVRTGSFTNFDQILSLNAKVHPSVARSPDTAFHMTPATFAFLQTLKPTNYTYFYDISKNTWTLAGSPIVFNQVMSSPNSVGSFAIGDVPVIYGDLKRAVTMVTGRDTQLRASYEYYFAQNEVALRLTEDVNFGLVLSAAYSRLVITS